MIPLADARLYAFVDSAYLRDRDPADLARQLADGGADLIQLRAKEWPADRIERVADALLPVCASAGVRMVINDHPAIAARVGAPLLHLGQEDFFDAGHQRVADFTAQTFPSSSPGRRAPGLGLSTHAPAQALRAIAAGPEYIAIGPVFPTPTKPGRAAVTLDYVRWAATNVTTLPWFAIGGIHRGNLDTVLDAGARRVCIVSDILRSDTPGAVCREYRRRLESFAPRAT